VKILTAAQMREVDRMTSEHCGVSPAQLMENAGQAVGVFLARHPEWLRGPVLVLCGRGNNGGDGLVVARWLLERGIPTRVLLLAVERELKTEAAQALRQFQASLPRADGSFRSLPEGAGWDEEHERLPEYSLVVDAILGTGVRLPLPTWLRPVVADLNHLRAAVPVVAVDMPTGLPSEGQEDFDLTGVVHATATVSFTAPKWGLLQARAADCVGELELAQIGTPAELVEETASPGRLAGPGICRPFLAPRSRHAHKGAFGHVLLIGGSRDMAGAVAMAAEAALRMGAGLVTVAVPTSIQAIVAAYRPELIVHGLSESSSGTLTLAGSAASELDALLSGKTLLAIGPGLSDAPEAAEAVRHLITTASLPWVLDADGLNAFAGLREELRVRPPLRGVLTPHPGEMARLFQTTPGSIQAARLERARELAAETGAVVVLKGHRSLSVSPDGGVVVNSTGNPGMATAGSGDVLTGIVAGLCAQFPRADLLAVTAAAVYLHGLAGDLAAAELGERGLLATDITRHLAAAMRQVMEASA